MKNKLSRLALLSSLSVMLMGVGCISPEFLASQAGFVAGTGYLVVNTPPAEEVQAVRKVIKEVAVFTTSLDPENSFASLYGPVSRKIVAEFTGTTRLLALSATRSVLDALDTFFIVHPDWRKNKDLVVNITQAFVKGTDRAFGLFSDDDGNRALILSVKSASARAYGAVSVGVPSVP